MEQAGGGLVDADLHGAAVELNLLVLGASEGAVSVTATSSRSAWAQQS
jgi:hypothetical protein